MVGDRDRLSQILTNLLGNVVRHTPSGTPVEIAIGMAPPHANPTAQPVVVVEVRDHGPGVAPDVLPSLNLKMQASRELPVVWAVAKGSMVNKAILVPAALLISWLAPWLITPLLMLGGAFLCFEGFEKLAHKFLHGAEDAAHEQELAAADPGQRAFLRSALPYWESLVRDPEQVGEDASDLHETGQPPVVADVDP